MDYKLKLQALETVDDLIGVYRAELERWRLQLSAMAEHQDYLARKDIENSIAGCEAVVERLGVVRTVISDALRRRKSPRKRGGAGQAPPRRGPW